jgi:isocitrate/isopropylmalate dehydrogenase
MTQATIQIALIKGDGIGVEVSAAALAIATVFPRLEVDYQVLVVCVYFAKKSLNHLSKFRLLKLLYNR